MRCNDVVLLWKQYISYACSVLQRDLQRGPPKGPTLLLVDLLRCAAPQETLQGTGWLNSRPKVGIQLHMSYRKLDYLS